MQIRDDGEAHYEGRGNAKKGEEKDMKSVFISLTGTQVMAVLNPLLAITEQHQVPDSILLLGTEFARDKFDPVLAYLNAHPPFADRVEWRTISRTLEKDAAGLPPAQDALREIIMSGDRRGGLTVFNQAGGMGFQTAACVQALAGVNRLLYVYPDYTGIHAFRFQGDSLEEHSEFPLPDMADVFRFQGIDFMNCPSTGSRAELLEQAFKNSGAPDRALLKNVYIEDVCFDLVYNKGNTLHFFAVVKNTDEMRSVNRLAAGRSAFADLYHRGVHVMTTNRYAAERGREESGGKVKIYRKSKLPEAMQAAVAAVSIPSRAAAPPVARMPSPWRINNKLATGNDIALLTTLGPNILPTLIALWTCRPKRAVLFFTPNDDQVKKAVANMEKWQDLLPAEILEFRPMDFWGKEIGRFNKSGAGNWQVNISPGTKAQKLFLTRWAAGNGATLVSIVTADQKLHQIPSGITADLNAPDPVSLLKLAGETIDDKYLDKAGLKKNKRDLEMLAGFLTAIKNSEQRSALKSFPNFPLKMVGYSFASEKKGFCLSRKTGGKERKIRMATGFWLELLTGYMLVKAGADDVAVRVRTQWSEELSKDLNSNPFLRSEPFRTDFDVIARFAARYFVIECKTSRDESLRKSGRQVLKVAGVLARFAVPLVCKFSKADEPLKTDDGVYAFGHTTLLDPEKLKGLLEKAAAERRTTD